MKIDGKTGDRSYTEAEVVLAVQLAAGSTMVDATEVLGISEKWAYTLRARSREAIDELSAKIQPLCRVNKRQALAVAREKAEEELEKRLGASFAALDDALNKGDYTLAYAASREVRDRLLGKAASTVNINSRGTVTVNHYVASPEVLAAFDDDVLADRELHGKVRQLRGASLSVAEAIDVLASSAD